MLHGLYWLLNNVADERPLALAVDDVHWSDPESLRFFNYLAPGWTASARRPRPSAAVSTSPRTWLGWPPVPRRPSCDPDR